jgi:hypothetical protein
VAREYRLGLKLATLSVQGIELGDTPRTNPELDSMAVLPLLHLFPPEQGSAAQMPEYRVYTIGKDGHIAGPPAIIDRRRSSGPKDRRNNPRAMSLSDYESSDVLSLL